jgi:hypothetical protein
VGKFFKIPMPYEYGFFFNLGRVIADAQLTGDVGKLPWQLASSFVDAFTPFGSAVAGDKPDLDQFATFMMPAALQIPLSVATNRTAFGGEMRPESKYQEHEPNRDQMYRATRGTVYDALAGALDKTGLDVSPGTLKYLTRTFSGDAGATASRVYDAVSLKAQGAALELREIPFVRNLVTEADVRGARGRYYEARSDVVRFKEAFDRAVKTHDVEKSWTTLMNHREEILLARLADKQGKLLQETRDYADQIRLSGKYSKAEERVLIKEVEQFEEKIYDG